ncbi:TonB-dependent receptor [Echinicola marina]|uniref:TonB-dependent receptor n=1 Tax=Echinicola marina TaxID=2859768 RepID=UPI001CF6AAEE|nr:TonB-dependent receptor [Echinicola marina]UCS92054.1 TonB-dependent receptor [Echinicola marina]
MKKLLISTFLVILFFAMVYPTHGQEPSGTVAGYVREAKTQEPLIGVAVKLLGTELGAVTDINGFFTINEVPPKTYTLEASYIGFTKKQVFNLAVRSGGNPDVNIFLEEEVSELEGVVVVANAFGKDEETPLSVNRLSLEEIATYPGGNNDIAKVVQALPGVSGSVGGFRNDVIIRGGAPNENVYYLDGIEIPNINHFSTQGSAGGPVGLLNVSFFEGVSLSTSAFTANYDNVLSGVLQFDQRNGNNRKFHSNVRVSSSEAALTLEGPLFKGDKDDSRTSFIASVRRSYLQVLFKALELPFLPDYWDFQYKVSHEIDRYNSLIFTGLGSIDDFAINQPDDIDEEQQATLDQLPVIKQWSSTHGAVWKRRFKNGSGYMTTALSNNILNNNFRQFEDVANEEGEYLTNDAQEQETKLRYNLTKFIGAWTLSTGAILQRADYKNSSVDLVNDFAYESQLDFFRYGFYAQLTRNFFQEKLSLSAGFRMDGNDFMNEGNKLYKTWSPRFSFGYVLDNARKWSFNGSIGRYYKIPPYTVLGFQNLAGKFVNKNTQYIQSDHYVAGFEYLINPSTRITLEGFYKKYDNYPVSLSKNVSLANLGGDFSVLGNEPVASVGKGRTYGTELLIQKKFTRNFYGILALTLYKSEYTGLDENVYLPSSWDNRTLLTFTGGYKFEKNWEISTRIRYLGKTPIAPVDEEATLESYPAIIKDYNRQGEILLNPFNQTDLRVDKKWNFNNFTFNAFLEFQNLFGQDTPSEPLYGLDRDDEGNITEPRTLKEIPAISSGSVLPSIGLVLDF